MKYFLFDIETIPTRNNLVIDLFKDEDAETGCKAKAPTSAKPKPETIAKYENEVANWFTPESIANRISDAVGKTSKNPLLAEIIVISAIADGVSYRFSTNQSTEFQLLWSFKKFIDEFISHKTYYVGYFIKGFDLGVIWNRFIYHGIEPPVNFPSYYRGWRGNVMDLSDLVPCNPGTSLDLICRAYGIKGKSVIWKGKTMNGSRVTEAYEAGEFDMLDSYCDDDVAITWELFKKIKRPNTL